MYDYVPMKTLKRLFF